MTIIKNGIVTTTSAANNAKRIIIPNVLLMIANSFNFIMLFVVLVGWLVGYVNLFSYYL